MSSWPPRPPDHFRARRKWGSTWQLRLAQLEDAVEIVRLVTELGYPVETAAIVSRLHELLAHPNHLVTVAAGPNGCLSGVIMAEHRCLLLSGAEVEIRELSVGVEARRRGSRPGARARGRKMGAAIWRRPGGRALE